MQVKGKIFPYPVLNNNSILSNFKKGTFNLEYEAEVNETSFILKKARFSTESKTINKLFIEGKIGVCLIVECSYTVYRKAFELSDRPKDIILKKVDFSEQVDISLFAYAKEDYVLVSDELEEDYQDIEFSIEKYDIIAANDGFNVSFRHEEIFDNVIESIFSIIVDHDNKEGPYSVDFERNPRKIVVVLSEKDFNNYQIVQAFPDYREVFFCMLLIPALQEALNPCLNIIRYEGKDLDDICDKFLWFRSVMSAYERIEGKRLTSDDLKNSSSCMLAQKLLGNPLGVSMIKLVSALKWAEGEEDE